MDLLITALLIVALFVLLGSGVWIGIALAGVAWIGMELFSSRPAGDAMAVTIWGSASSWTLTALPLFVWMGEILFRTRLSEDMFKGLAPWLERVPGRLLHTNIIGCTIFAAVSGSSAATCATIGKMTLPELKRRGYPEDITIGTLAGAGTLGLLIPPSIIMIVYGVSANVSISHLFIAGIVPGIVLATLFSGYIVVWALFNKARIPVIAEHYLHRFADLLPLVVPGRDPMGTTHRIKGVHYRNHQRQGVSEPDNGRFHVQMVPVSHSNIGTTGYINIFLHDRQNCCLHHVFDDRRG